MAFVTGHNHDIFVSYAHIDNEPLLAGAAGWVTTFVEILTTVVGQKLGVGRNRLDVWIDAELAGNAPFPAQLESTLHRTATLVVIMSPGYLASAWCRRERDTFRQVVSAKARQGSRVFVVHRDHVDRKQMPSEFRDLVGYRFWTEAGLGEPPRTLGVPVPLPSDREYYGQINQLGNELAEELRRLEATVVVPSVDPSSPAVGEGPAVFLAEVTDDLDLRREEVRRFLSQAGIPILPTVYYPHDDAEAFGEAMTRDLARCKVFVQLLGPVVGRRTPAAPQGFSALQYELARGQGIAILQWRARDVDLSLVDDENQRRLLDTDTVRACGLEELKETIAEEIRRAPPAAQRAKPANALIFVNSDELDRSLAEQICQLLLHQGLGYSMPLRAGNPEEIRSDLEENLQICDGLVLVYGTASPAWVRSQLRQCRKAISQRDQPLAALALFEGPPPDKTDLDLGFPDLQRLDCRRGLSEAALAGFIQSLRI